MHDIASSLHRPKVYACASCGVIWSPSGHEVNNLLTTYGTLCDHDAVVNPCSDEDHTTLPPRFEIQDSFPGPCFHLISWDLIELEVL